MCCQIHSRKLPGKSIELIRIEESFKGIKCKDIFEYLVEPKHSLAINKTYTENIVVDEDFIEKTENFSDISYANKGGVSLCQTRYQRHNFPLMSDRDSIF